MQGVPTTPALQRYVPRHVLARLADAMPSKSRVTSSARDFDGVVLMLDIVGFSGLTERYAQAGAVGAERLSVLLDQYFGRMTDIALAHGGDVVDFVGDAMLVIWEAPAAATRDTAVIAVQCGLALQRALPDIVAQTGASLQQRISLASGRLTHFTVGGVDDKWHCLTAGGPLAQAAAENHQARAGEVMVCAALWGDVHAHCTGREARAGGCGIEAVHTPLALPPLPLCPAPPGDAPRLLEGYLAQPFLERLRVSGGSWLGEFRNITTLFVGLPGVDCSDAGALAALQGAVECAQRAHQRYGGILTRLSTDDKGVTLLCGFGLPMTAREDDAVRALSAAAALTTAMNELGIPSKIGITTGQVFYADSGGEQRRHAALVGGAVNLAARLMVASDGGMLCDEATQRAAARGFEFDARPPVSAKGFDAPIAVATPRARAAGVRRAYEGASIGRAAEFGELARAVALLAGGAHSPGGCMVLRGEAGIGKSRLIADAAAEARARDIRVLWSAGVALEIATVYFPWRHFLAQLLCGDGVFDAALARAQAQRLIGGDERLQSWLPLLNDVLPLHLPDTVIAAQMTGQARAASLRALLLALTAHSARDAPMLWVADDLHWFDGASAAMLSALVAANVPRLLVLGGTRPLEASAAVEVSGFIRAARCMDLAALPLAAVRQIIANKLDAVEVSPALAAFITARAAGNPFYVEEIVLAMRAARYIDVSAGLCGFAPGVDEGALAALPDSLRGVIVSRIDALGAAEQLALKAASVIGREFSLPMLRDLLPRADAADNLPNVLDILVREDVVRPAGDGARGQYRFKHALLQDTVYEQLPFALRRDLHGAAAGWIERNEAHDLEPRYAVLALHWERALQASPAVDYLEKAAALSLRRYANHEAIAHARRALRVTAEHKLPVAAAREARWEAMLGDAHHELFEYRAATRHFKRALALAGRPAPRHIATLLLDLGWQMGVQAGARLGMARKGARDTLLPWASHIHEKLGEIAYFESRTVPLLHATLTSLNLAERSGAVREAVDGFAAMAIGFYGAGLHQLSRRYNQRSLALAAAQGSIEDVAYANLISGIYWAPQGRWPEVELALARSAALYTRIGALGRWQQTRTVLCAAELIRGRFARAREVLDELTPSVHHDTPVQVVAWQYCFETWLALARGDALAGWVTRLREVIGAPELQQVDRMFCNGLIAASCWRMGDHEGGLRAARAGLADLLESTPTAWYITAGIGGIVQTLMDAAAAGIAGDDESRRASRALNRYARVSQVAAPRAALFEGRRAAATGAARRADAVWRRGLSAARAFGAAHDEAMLLFDMATRGAYASDTRATFLAQAHEIFARIGVTPAASLAASV